MPDKTNDVTGWYRAPPPSRPFWSRFRNAIYDPQEKSFLGRTPKKWGISLAFYTVFYAVLALLFGVCMTVLMMTIDEKVPFYSLDESLIGTNPGVTHRPRPWPVDGDEIRYNANNFTHYVRELQEFMQPYKKDSLYASPSSCNSEDNFGYPQQPCILIKLNRVYKWQPLYYNDTSQLPAGMPSDLAEHISQLSEQNRQQLWVSCAGERGAAVEVQYPWGRGLPGSYYPYLNTPDYNGPVLAVKITPTPNKLTIVRCKVWAKNIIQNDSLRDASGYTRILIFMESNDSLVAVK